MNKRQRTDEATISVNIRFDTRRKRINNTYPTKLEVYFKGIKKRYDLKTYFSTEEWEKANSPKLKDNNIKARKSHIETEKSRASKIINDLGNNFSFESFESLYLNKTKTDKSSKKDVYSYLEKHIKSLISNDQLGYAESFSSTLFNLKRYANTLYFKDLTPKFLEGFEKWMLSKEKSITTVGIYVRNLRVIYNLAIEEGIAKRENYPFGQAKKKKYEIPIGLNPKKAIPEEDIRRIAQLEGLYGNKERARDIWLFSFLCNGMNLADVFRLRYSDIDGDFFSFKRKKLSGRQKNRPLIEVFLTNKAVQIISKWGNDNCNPNNYVFPFLTPGLSSKEERRIVKNLTKNINYYMGKVATQLEIKTDLTTYVARHSYCTILRNKGVDIPEISENVGHSQLSTTTKYFARYSSERKKITGRIIDEII